MRKIIYAVSDSAGDTAWAVAKAAGNQFDQTIIKVVRKPYVLSKEQIDEIFEKAAGNRGMIVHTLINPELRQYLQEKKDEYDIDVIDVLGPVIWSAEKLTHEDADMNVGQARRLSNDYFKRIDAMEFAVKYDDGKDPSGFPKADIVILGVSRTSKTPLSLFLAYNYGIKTANLPLVPEVPLPKEIFTIPPRKIIGLIIDTYKLNVIRKTRMENMGIQGDSDYFRVSRINSEMEYARGIMRHLHCNIIDVSNKSIEETASHIVQIAEKNKIIDEKTGLC